MNLKSRFHEVVSTEEQFRTVMGRPSSVVVRKELTVLDSYARNFIEHSPFVIVGTAGADGHLDMSPKGDPAGFVMVIDDSTLAIPDRLGNRRADTFKNLLVNDQVGLIFMIPGKPETLRVSGRAIIVRDTALRERMAVRDKLPDFAIVVEVSRMFFHCAKCAVRSSLWDHEAWPEPSGLPSIAEATVSAAKLTMSVADAQAIADNDIRTRLY